mmetsp:Transcript_15883/g.51759  ORF Transcript_15883/g.51759 Transcript_15883/m.51759 type:complete len:210 (+) Transcript_15883:55-684(+)
MLPQAPFLVIGLLSAPHRPAAPTLRLCSVSLANSGRQERGAAARKRLSGSFVDAPDEYEEPLKSAARAEWEAAADAAMKELDADFDAEERYWSDKPGRWNAKQQLWADGSTRPAMMAKRRRVVRARAKRTPKVPPPLSAAGEARRAARRLLARDEREWFERRVERDMERRRAAGLEGSRGGGGFGAASRLLTSRDGCSSRRSRGAAAAA